MTSNGQTLRASGLQRLTAGLYASAPQELSFAPELEVRAFLLPSADGNILLNASDGLLEDAEAVDAVGGLSAIWLGHWHERLTGVSALAKRFSAPVFVHAADRRETEKEVPVAGTFEAKTEVRPGLTAHPIPGHTPGSVAYLQEGPEGRCLFTADSLFVRDGELRAALLESSDRAAYVESLRALRGIEVDLLVPWVARKGAPVATPYGSGEFAAAIDAVVARLEAGGDG